MIWRLNASLGECRIYRTLFSNTSLVISRRFVFTCYISSTFEETHHRAYSSNRFTTSLFKSSSPNTNFLASLSIPCRAGCLHFPPTLGVSGARALALGVDCLFCGVVAAAEFCSRWGVAKMGGGGARCTGVGGVYGLWKPDKLLPSRNVSMQGTKGGSAWLVTRRSVKLCRRARRIRRLA